MTKVYVVNRSAHDFSDAERFGELTYLSEGPMSRTAINHMFRVFLPLLRDSTPDDYIIPSGMTHMSMVAASIFCFLHGRVNLLIFEKGRYVPKVALLREILEGEDVPTT